MTTGASGELAALGVALCWTASALAFTAAGRRLGSLSLNFIRLILALVLLAGWGVMTRGQWWPADAPPGAWGWLLLSGFVGFFLGDLCLFEAYLRIGTRLAMLFMTLTPVLAAVAGWLLLDERLTGRDGAGMAVTLAGIWLVLSERHGAPVSPQAGRQRWSGMWLGGGAAAGQALGLVFGKQGMGDYDAFAATQIRACAGLAGFAMLLAVGGRWRALLTAVRHGPGMGYAAVGAVFGPFLGVALTMWAVQRAPTGVVATITALTPVLLIPIAVKWHGERVGWRAVAGTVVAVAGVAVICWKPG